MTNFRLILEKDKLNSLKLKQVNLSSSKQSKSKINEINESLKPVGYEDQGYRDEC